MASFEDDYYLGNATRRARLRRDVRLAFYLAGKTLQYFTFGRRIRRALRGARARGEELKVDGLPRGRI
jgi:hypothetical protein